MLRNLDSGVLAGYLAALLALGFVLSRRKASVSEYFLASRHASWPAVGLALVGSNISPGVLIGITGAAYAFGISVYDYDWTATVILVVFALFFLPAVLAARVYTMPEFLERRYDRRVRIWFSSLTLFLYVFLDAAGSLYCGTLVLKFIVPGLSFGAAVAVLAVLSVLYSVTGGLRSVLYTQAVQAVVVLVSALLLAGFAFVAAGGWQPVMHAAPVEYMSLIRPASDPYMPWTGLAFGLPILGFYYWCTNQVIVQRMLAARSIEDRQKGALLAGLLKLLTLFVIVLPGVAGHVLYPRLLHGDEIYLRLAFGLMPPGLLGLLLAAFLGALMAQLSASYNSAATLVVIDFVRRLRPDASDQAVVRWGRVATILCMVVSAAWAPQIVRFPSLWQYFQAVLAYTTPPVVVLFLAGLLWPRANALGAILAVAIGTGLGLSLFTLSVLGLLNLQFLNAAVVVFCASFIALMIGSLWGPHVAPPASHEYEYSLGTALRQSRSGGPSVRIWAAALVALTAGIVIWFR
ncbi:MAG: sodium/solute symporter [Alphaproteobacteria bacterium]|nr:sodium/solute symporter [Alphaproteobacteria bacterium]